MKPTPNELRIEFYALPTDALIDRDTVAAVLYLKRQTVELLAIKGGGPPYSRICRRALYRKSEFLAWAAKSGRRVENTVRVPTSADDGI